MQYIKFGRHEQQISRFGLGCMRFPKNKDKKLDEKTAISMVRYAIDHGVNYLDTAYTYPGSEELLGKALQGGYRARALIATKFPTWEVEKYADFERILQQQLKRLKTDYIDVYLLHNLNLSSWQRALQAGALEFFNRAKEEGFIRFAGFSIHDRFPIFKEIADAYPWDMTMIQYNYYDRYNQVTWQALDYAADKGLATVVMEPLRGGMLAQNLPPAVSRVLEDFRPGLSPAEKAFIWLYNQEKIAVILSGCANMAHLKEDIRIFSQAEAGILTPEEEAIFEKARLAWAEEIKVACTGCGYCLPCPQGVEIADIFRLYNDQAGTAHHQVQRNNLYQNTLMLTGNDASHCNACRACERACPQGLAIVEKLKEAHTEMSREEEE